jgi:mitochondrial fission protein ELM1
MCALRVPAVHFGAAAPERRPDRTGTTPGRIIGSTTPAALRQPTVWVLASPRAGDASQVLALAEAIGWPFEIKRLTFKPLNILLAPPFVTSDAGLDRARSSALAAPWPDLVLASGRENEPVARWIKRQSGGRTQIVQVGRPWGPLAAYDLVVTTPQYRLPARPNVLENAVPLHRVTPERLEAAAGRWEERLARLPRPLIAVLVGGNSGPYALTRRSGQRLATAARAMAAELGGSLLVTTSSRSPRAAARALEEGLAGPHLLYRWRKGDPDNPYFAFLALADEIIVTADSMSMVSEALATGKRVHLFDLGQGWTSMRAPLANCGEQLVAGPGLRAWLSDFHLQARLYRWLLRLAPSRVTRDIRLVHQQLVESGRAAWLGEPRSDEPPPPLDDVDRAVARVRRLMVRPAALGVAADHLAAPPVLVEAAG